MKKPKKVKVKVNGYEIVSSALDFAVERGMNRCDKYATVPLTDAHRELLTREIVASFWLAMDDAGAVIQ